MLVLTRKTQQQIQIGDKITITILRVKGNSVRVGIDAPRDERIIRSELTEKPLAEDRTSTSAKPAIDVQTAPVAGHRAADEIEMDDHDETASETASPLANRVRVLSSQMVRYPERMNARSMRCVLGRR